MDKKEVADLLRKVADDGAAIPEKLRRLADDINQQLPAPGTPVLWRHDSSVSWKHGVVENGGIVRDVNGHWTYLANMQWKPARIAGENEVIVNRDDLMGAIGRLHADEPVTKRLYAAIRKANDE